MLLEEVPRRSQDFHDLWNYRSVYPRNVPGTSHDFHDLGMHEYSHVTRVPQWISQEVLRTSEVLHSCSHVTSRDIPGSPRNIPGHY